ncbi:DUF2510 domain-containing protein [Rhodococcus sp. NPDC127530]|uniref:DUF2510 domain-containing protein n=1 Tax=unclassified Rhodococcus (in: high G+C Gram-positive bacteria) TaxID=192944 RepID=UPI003641E643
MTDPNSNWPVPYQPNPSAASGWYPDPAGSGQVRWWDGQHWAPLQYPALQNSVPHHVVVHQPVGLVAPKSVGVAFLLAFLFGPLGLLYASVAGGIIMLAVGFFAFFLSFVSFGFPFLVHWIICMIWACVAANGHNERIRRGMMH